MGGKHQHILCLLVVVANYVTKFFDATGSAAVEHVQGHLE